MPLPFPGWLVVDTLPGDTKAPVDRGHGIVLYKLGSKPDRKYPLIDTVLFRATPDTGAAVVGALVVTMPTATGAFFQEVWAPVQLTSNAVEYEIEMTGTPYDSIDVTGRWHRAILGFRESSGQPWFGWTSLADPVLTRQTWKERLMNNDVYFIDFYSGTFHASPNGPVVTTERALADSGFDVRSVEARWPWLRVRVDHPGRNCDGKEMPNRRADYYWVRAFDERGRPRVFFPTSGC